MSFAHIIGHERHITLLKRALAEGTLAHALLFTGLKGVGKRTLAWAAAAALLCDRSLSGEACGMCESCRRFDQGQHPDFMEVAPRQKDITIDQIRDVRNSFRIGPVMGKHRVVLIRDASAMNAYASNALLKTLEEPAPGNFLFLTTGDEHDLFPTIVSRCRHIRLNPLSSMLVAENLVSQTGISSSTADTVARLCGGSYGRALAMAEGWDDPENDILALRRDFIQKLQGLDKSDTVGLLALARELDQLKDDVLEFLEMLKIWFRDLLLHLHGVSGDRYANADLVQLISQHPGKESEETIMTKLDLIEKARRNLLNNASRLLTVEVLILRMARI